MKQIINLIISLVLILTNCWSNAEDDIMRINVLDIGQGDSIYIETGDDISLLVDTGENNSTVFQIAKVRKVPSKRIDFLILTHYDLDHVGGLYEVIDRYDVSYAVVPYIPLQTDSDYKFITALQEANIEILTLNSSKDLKLGCCVSLDVLWPQNNQPVEDSNSSSVAFALTYGNFDMYMGGDLPAKEEKESLSNFNRDIEIFKLGHHGSKTSTSQEMIDILKPEIGIISVGKDNKYGHPNKETLSLLEQNQLKSYLTSELGNITIATDGNTYSIITK